MPRIRVEDIKESIMNTEKIRFFLLIIEILTFRVLLILFLKEG